MVFVKSTKSSGLQAVVSLLLAFVLTLGNFSQSPDLLRSEGACNESCQCEAETALDFTGEDHQHTPSAVECEHDLPSEDDCSEACSDCSCNSPITFGILDYSSQGVGDLPADSGARLIGSNTPSGFFGKVFRPPRPTL